MSWHVVDRELPEQGALVFTAEEDDGGYAYSLGEWSGSGDYIDWLGERGLLNPSHWHPLPDEPQPIGRLF